MSGRDKKQNKKNKSTKDVDKVQDTNSKTISDAKTEAPKNLTELMVNDKSVKIFLDKIELDTETLKQIKTMMDHDCIESARVMPDCHKGNGCCIGFTFPLIDKIVPNYIGGDIGCGILTYKMGNFNHNKKEKQIDICIRQHVPLGAGSEGVHAVPIATEADYQWMFTRAQQIAKRFCENYQIRFNKDLTSTVPTYSQQWFSDLCDKIVIDYAFVQKELATLGSGNHFIEVNIDSDNNKYLTVHSGSRILGSKICEYHQRKTNDKFDWDQYNQHMNEYRKNNPGTTNGQQKIESARIKQILEAKVHKPYLQDEEAYDYYFDMIFAQSFAQLNRRIMCRQIINNLAYGITPYDESNIIESVHNMIDFEDMIVRKGAISAHQDALCIVSLNMRDGILLCRGLGNKDWNLSGPHGLGRNIDRGRAKQKIRLQDFIKEMKDVYSTSVCESTLDESPMAYKDSETVISALGPSLEIISQLKPIINVKAL